MRVPQSTVNDAEASAGPSTPPANTRERASQSQIPVEDEERSRSAELARMQTVNFLSKLTKEGYAKEYRKRDTDELVEKCYFSCTQTSTVIKDKRVRREPDCTAWCYIRLKDKGKQAKAALVADEIPSFYPRPPIDPENDDSRYRFSFLDDKFFFRARGRMAIAKHAEEDLNVKSLYELEQVQATAPPPMISRAEKLGLIAKQRMAPMPSYERLYPLGTGVASRLHRFEKHLVRIYGPTFNALKRMPSLWADGTVQKTGWQIYESAVNGDGLALGQRLFGVAQDTYKKFRESTSGDNGSGFPPVFPRPPSAGPGGSGSGPGSSSSTGSGETSGT